MTDANKLYHKWMRQWGSCIGEHETEIVSDIINFASDMDAKLRQNYPKNLRFARNEALEEAAGVIQSLIDDCWDIPLGLKDKIRALKS